MGFYLVQTAAVSLYSGMSAVATTMRITPSPVDLDGTKLTMADFGTVGYCTVDPKIANYEEIISFTGLTDNGDNTTTLTGLSRNLISKSPYTTAGTGKVHGSSAVVVFSDNPQVYNQFALLNKRVQSVADAATVTPALDTNDAIDVTAIAQNFTIANPTGTATNFRTFVMRILDNGVARTITFGTQYRAMGNALPTITVAGKRMVLGFMWDSTASKWDLVALLNEA